MAVFAHPDSRIEYILKRDRTKQPEEQTKWFFRPLTHAQYIDVMRRNRKLEEDDLGGAASYSQHVCQLALVGWEGLEVDLDGSTTDCEFSKEAIKDLPQSYKGELAMEIIRQAVLSFDDQKN